MRLGIGIQITGGISPPPSSGRVDQSGAYRVDQNGKYRTAAPISPVPLLPRLKDVAAASGRVFGTEVPRAVVLDPSADSRHIPGFLDLIIANSDMWVPGGDFQPPLVWPAPDTFNFTEGAAFIQRALNAGKSWRYHVGFYPDHDTSWVSPVTVTSANYKALIDAYMTAMAAVPNIGTAKFIDVTNELFVGTTTANGGYRTHPWHVASAVGTVPSSAPHPVAGYDIPDWIAYLYLQMKAAFPTGPRLTICDSGWENDTDGFNDTLVANLLNFVTKGVGSGLPIEVLNIQGHMKLIRGFNAKKVDTLCKAVKALGLDIILGEIDCRASSGTAANYTPWEYSNQCADQIKRLIDTVGPYVKAGDPIFSWGLCDLDQSWGADESPLPFDRSMQTKRQYDAFRQALQGLI